MQYLFYKLERVRKRGLRIVIFDLNRLFTLHLYFSKRSSSLVCRLHSYKSQRKRLEAVCTPLPFLLSYILHFLPFSCLCTVTSVSSPVSHVSVCYCWLRLLFPRTLTNLWPSSFCEVLIASERVR